jgi:ABC-2 type transport system permease protein
MKLFFNFTRMEFHAAAMYRVEFWMSFFGNLVGMYGAYWLWKTLYAQQPASFPVSLEQMIAYGMLAMLLNAIFNAAVDARYHIMDRVRTGSLQMDLLRPLDFHFHMLARDGGRLILTILTLGLPGFALAALFLGLRPPAHLAGGLLFLLSVALAFIIYFSLNFLVGMVSFYSTEARHIAWVYYTVVAFLSGQYVPVWVFSLPVARVVALLPFQGIIGGPVSIYIGRLSPGETATTLALQVFWAAVLLALGQLVWRHAYTRLTVQGG